MPANAFRSMLFVPASRPEWMRKATKYGADALIFDLEDGVPLDGKQAAASAARSELCENASSLTPRFVRVNGWPDGRLVQDLLEVVCSGLAGVVLPKTSSADDVVAADRVLTELEAREGLARGSIEIMPLIETAIGVENVSEIVRASPRVRRVASSGDGGDLQSDLGYASSPTGHGALYSLARVCVAARAAQLVNVFLGGTTTVDDVRAAHDAARACQSLGANGVIAIHPSQVSVYNLAFTPTEDEIVEARTVLAALDAARSRGQAAATHDGRMIDMVHERWAKRILAPPGSTAGEELPLETEPQT